MTFYRIVHYHVAVLTGYGDVVRQLFLTVTRPSQNDTEKTGVLRFFPLDVSPPPPNHVEDRRMVFSASLPLRDFADIYHVIRTEKSAYIQVGADGRTVQIGTFDEALGKVLRGIEAESGS